VKVNGGKASVVLTQIKEPSDINFNFVSSAMVLM
jgi:hypothetical protein